MRRIFQHYIPPAAYMAGILYLSLRSEPIEPVLFPHADKLNHLAAYAVMSALWMRTLIVRTTAGRALAASMAISFVFGALVEALQSYAPPRDASVLDAVANGIGAVIGAYAFKIFKARVKPAGEA
ncbi:MAG: VanZ family protein [Deltaproteobacteria bacterium]|nr:VanZ family protein [Deltaproteobacteria bacterium]